MLAARVVVRKALLGPLFLLTACASATVVPPEAAPSLKSLRSSLESGKAQIQRTSEAARLLALAAPEEVDARIAQLLQEVDALETIAGQSRAQHEAQHGEATAYFAQWDTELKTMSESVQEAGQERRAENLQAFESLSHELSELQATFRPYMDALAEVARYLKGDKTAAGLEVVHPRIEDALDVHPELMSEIDDATGHIDAMLGG